MERIETIGERAYSECLRLWGSVPAATKALGVSQKLIIYRWGRGAACPHAYYLSKLYENGADIKYILLGVRENELP